MTPCNRSHVQFHDLPAKRASVLGSNAVIYAFVAHVVSTAVQFDAVSISQGCVVAYWTCAEALSCPGAVCAEASVVNGASSAISANATSLE